MLNNNNKNGFDVRKRLDVFCLFISLRSFHDVRSPGAHQKRKKSVFQLSFFFFLLKLMFEDLKLPSKQLTVKNEEEKKASF